MAARHFLFTSFLEDAPVFGPSCRYLVYQREVGGETYHPHWQGYAEFEKPMRIKAAQASLGILWQHMEKRKSKRSKVKADDQCYTYCTKETDAEWRQKTGKPSDPTKTGYRLWGPYEYGEWNTNQGARSDLAAACAMVKEGKTGKEIFAALPETWVRYGRGLKDGMTQLHAGQRDWKTEVILIQGDTGSGKSRLAFDMARKDGSWYSKSDGSQWWDNYYGQRVIIFDDFRPHWFKLSHLLKLIDRYPLQVQTKGGHTDILAKTFIITSIVPLEQWYTDEKEDAQRQLRRRITKIIDLGVGSKILDAVYDYSSEEDENDTIPPEVPK